MLRMAISSEGCSSDRMTVCLVARMDIGEHLFRFRLNAGPCRERLENVDRESRLLNRPPMSLCCYPRKNGLKAGTAIRLSNPAIRLGALKWSEEGDKLVIRLFETTGNPARCDLFIPSIRSESSWVFKPFEIITLMADPETGEVYG